jgi:hypothetical protein
MKHPMVTVHELIKYIYDGWETFTITIVIGTLTLGISLYLFQYIAKGVIPVI